MAKSKFEELFNSIEDGKNESLKRQELAIQKAALEKKEFEDWIKKQDKEAITPVIKLLEKDCIAKGYDFKIMPFLENIMSATKQNILFKKYSITISKVPIELSISEKNNTGIEILIKSTNPNFKNSARIEYKKGDQVTPESVELEIANGIKEVLSR